MEQLLILVIVLNSASGFLRLLLTGSKVSACKSEKRNNRVTGKGKQGYYLHRKILFQTITIITKFGFERYILTKNKEKY